MGMCTPGGALAGSDEAAPRQEASLDGTWRRSPFTYHQERPGAPGGDAPWAQTAFADAQWAQTPVPRAWFDARGDGATLLKDLREQRFRFVTARYRKRFALPAGLQTGRVFLAFGAVDYEAVIYVNGVRAGDHHGRYGDFRIDITDSVKRDGENVLAVWVMLDCPQSGGTGVRALEGYRMGRYPKFNVGGIYESVRLLRLPTVHVNHVRINPQLDRSTLGVEIVTTNTTGGLVRARLTAEIIPWTGDDEEASPSDPVTRSDLGEVDLEPGPGLVSIAVPAAGLETWEIDRPRLYRLRLRLHAAGEVLDDFRERFGYRQFTTQGRRFLLNGRPFYILSGLKVYTDAWARGQASPQWMRRYVRDLRANHHNFLRLHGGPWPEWLYDICDEEGLLVMSEWQGQWRPEQEVDGRPPPIADEVMAMHRRNYNHPSWAILTIANESTDVAAMAHTYDYLKPRDGQQRPILTASGGQLYVEPVVHRTDVYGAHRYYGMGGYPASFIPTDIELLRLNVKRFRGTDAFPFIMNECNIVRGGDLNEAVPDDSYDHYTLDEYLAAARSHGSTDPERQDKMMPIASIAPNTPQRPSWQASQFVKKLVEMFRIDDHLLQGILPWQSSPSQGRQNFQPVFVGTSLNWQDKAEFAGREHTFQVHLRSYDTHPHRDVRLDLRVEDLEGRVVLACAPIDVGDVACGTRMDIDHAWTIPADIATGHYLLKLRLQGPDTTIARNLYELFILGVADQRPAMPAARVAVWRPRGLDGPSGVNVPAILEGLGVAHTVLADGAPDLGAYDVLILPAFYGDQPLERRSLPMHGTQVVLTEIPESFKQLTDRARPKWEEAYPGLVAAGPAISQWIEAGGRLLALEQFCEGPVPWQEELRIAESGFNCFVDPVRREHPALADFMIRDFADWEQERGVLIDYTIFPLNQNLIASVATYGYAGHPGGFGMALAETRIGKGSSILSQFNAVRRYGRDAIATHYVHELLAYAMGGSIWDGIRASPSVAQGQRPEISFHPTRYEQSFVGGDRQAAQSFTPRVVTNLTTVELEMWRSLDPPGSLIVELREDEDGRPGATVITSIVRPAGTLPRRRWYPNWQNPFKRFDLDCRKLRLGATYWLVARAEGPDRFPDIYAWIRGRDASDRPYADGRALVSSDGGRSWQDPNPSRETDFGMRIFGVADEHLPSWQLPAERAVKVDLRPWCTTGFRDDVAGDGQGGWTDQGANDLRHVPAGDLVWEGVALHIVDGEANDGRSCIMLRGKGRPDLPEAVRGIRIDAAAKALYFTHTSAWFYERGAGYVIHYADGTDQWVELANESNVADWWHPHDLPSASVAWQGPQPEGGGTVGIWMMRWQNPHPERRIATVDFVWRASGRGVVALLAITAEKL